AYYGEAELPYGTKLGSPPYRVHGGLLMRLNFPLALDMRSASYTLFFRRYPITLILHESPIPPARAARGAILATRQMYSFCPRRRRFARQRGPLGQSIRESAAKTIREAFVQHFSNLHVPSDANRVVSRMLVDIGRRLARLPSASWPKPSDEGQS